MELMTGNVVISEVDVYMSYYAIKKSTCLMGIQLVHGMYVIAEVSP